MHDIENESDIENLVNAFYGRVRNDELLGPIFNEVIGDHWDKHLPKMYGFWSAILLGTNRYHGNPIAAHVKLAIAPAHFSQWLEYFEQTVNEMFIGTKATLAIVRAQNIATIMQMKLQITQ